MTTNREFLRRRIESVIETRPTPAELAKTEWSHRFIDLMKRRRICCAFRYHPERVRKEHGYKIVQAMEKCLAGYKRTGNLELIADVATYAMTEFENPKHPSAHFAAEDDGKHRCL